MICKEVLRLILLVVSVLVLVVLFKWLLRTFLLRVVAYFVMHKVVRLERRRNIKMEKDFGSEHALLE